ncbi:MAG: hypothetical protein LUO93_08285 [Methanomicrobiales archaeon]|nr:hypothetical protein [Methanomicrobiales archaeon]
MDTVEGRLVVFLFSARNGYGTMSLLALLFVAVQFFQTGTYSTELFIVLVLGQAVYWISYIYYLNRMRRSGALEEGQIGHF